jgi:hypothetical protein
MRIGKLMRPAGCFDAFPRKQHTTDYQCEDETPMGTPGFLAPDVKKGDAYAYTPSTDYYALGKPPHTLSKGLRMRTAILGEHLMSLKSIN